MEEILKATIEYKNGLIDSVTVIVQFSADDVRTIQSTREKRSGYFSIKETTWLNKELLQEVASFGMEIEG